MRPLLRAATDTILNPAADRAAIRSAVFELHELFSTIGGVREDHGRPELDRDAWLAGGMAVSPLLAARCLTEVYRTAQFLRGVYAAIGAAMQRFPGQRLQILYPGCGPFATLLLPLTSQFGPEQIEITLIEAQPQSVQSVRRLIDALGLDAWFAAVVQGDALDYRHPPGQPLHMLVLEVMQGALAREPQAALTLHLLPQLAPGGILVPQKIVVDACLTSQAREDFATLERRDATGFPVDHSNLARQRIPLGRLLELSSDSAAGCGSNGHAGRWPPVTVAVPSRPAEENQFMLLTTVHIFGDVVIRDYESEVSHPVILYDLNSVASGAEIEFTYATGSKPGFHYTVAESRP
ncbi:MAG TPA: hypothetical protein P5148_00585 [Anaerolineae bacterium]|nr:hypothetical protein [Anaerolineae bacterium]